MARVLGIDIGGTGMKAAPVDTATGELVADRERILTPHPAVPDSMAAVFAQLTKHFEWTGPVGATFPAVVKGGVARTAANIDRSWIGTDVAKTFARASGCDVTVVNDADAAGVAEMEFGAGKGRQGVVMMVTLGTGIGTALFVDGRMVPNTELGHIMMGKKEAEARASDAVRQRLDLSWGKWAKRLDAYLLELERLLSPDLFILGGGVSKQHDKFIPRLTTHAAVVAAGLLNEAGIVGAAVFTDRAGNATPATSWNA
ncbi:MAG TPA: ROK family protein [Acidimicrobiia bacterium]|jgi:polyphosphate glucokinase|nr:ROK family protein [Acidimicrobiia bacterium]